MSHISHERSAAGVVTATLDRPPVNALDTAMMDDLLALAKVVEGDRQARVLVLRSATSAFMAGADLGMVRDNLGSVDQLNARLRQAFDAVEQLRVPTIAAISGHALGGGCELALVCDFRVMVQGRARIGLPEVLRGLLPAGGGTQRLARLVGRAAALDLLLRGRLLDAGEAAAIGLVTSACTGDELDDRVGGLAAELAGLAPLTLAAIKRVVLDGLDVPLSAGLDLEAQAMIDIGRTADAGEGVASFLEKRPPVFRGE
jgi:enoyl-CoA hydratase